MSTLNNTLLPEEQLLDLIKPFESYTYGCYYTDGMFVTDQKEMNRRPGKDITIQSPALIDKHRGGMCHDIALYVHSILTGKKIEHRVICVYSNKPPMYPTHSFIVARSNGKWFIIDIFATTAGYYTSSFDSIEGAVAARMKLWANDEKVDIQSMTAYVVNTVPQTGITIEPFISACIANGTKLTIDYSKARVLVEALQVTVVKDAVNTTDEILLTNTKVQGSGTALEDIVSNTNAAPYVVGAKPVDFSNEDISKSVGVNIKDNKIYHGSPFKLPVIKGDKTKKYSGVNGNVFVTPFKGIAACFLVNNSEIMTALEKQFDATVNDVFFSYSTWNEPVDHLRDIPSEVTIELNFLEFKPFVINSTGYIYTIDFDRYKDKCNMFFKSNTSDVEFLIEGDVQYLSFEKIEVKYTIVPSKDAVKRHGPAIVEKNLHIYITKPNTLQRDGVLSPQLTQEENLQHYAGRAKSTKKDDILAYLETRFVGRSRSISVLTEPIPDNAASALLQFRNESEHVILPPLSVLRKNKLVDGVYTSLGRQQWVRVADVDTEPLDWTKPVSVGLLFKNIRHYNLILSKGSIPAKYINLVQESEEGCVSSEMQTSDTLTNRIYNLAKPHYTEEGSNQWPHINRVMREANEFCAMLNIEMPIALYAAILFHDCDRFTKGHDHGVASSMITRNILKGVLSPADLDETVLAIAEHNNNKAGTTMVSELLKAADANIPDIPWFLNKIYGKRIDKGCSPEDCYNEALKVIKAGYMTMDQPGGYRPKYWEQRYKKKISSIRQEVAALTLDKVKSLLNEYWKDETKRGVYESIGSTENAADLAVKRQKVVDRICEVCDIMEPSKTNSARYRKLLNAMSDRQFGEFMQLMKDGKFKMHLIAPNMKINLQTEDLLNAARAVNLKLFHRIWMYDELTGRRFLTDNEYLVVQLPIRRQQQFLDKKLSVPDNDKTIDGLTGQVTGDSRACAITNPEIQILAARGLDRTLQEFVSVRGGNVAQYGEMKRQLEETGEASLDKLDPNSRTRVAVIAGVLLNAMMIDNNI